MNHAGRDAVGRAQATLEDWAPRRGQQRPALMLAPPPGRSSRHAWLSFSSYISNPTFGLTMAIRTTSPFLLPGVGTPLRPRPP